MGYREYFKIVDKKTVNALKRCKTEEDVYNVYLANGFEADKNEYHGEVSYSCPPYHIVGSEFEFGKYYENAESINSKSKPLYKGELAERFCDYNIVYGGEELILDAIKWQEEHIKKIYENLINNTFSDDWTKSYVEKDYRNEDGSINKKEMHYQRLLEHCEDQYRLGWNMRFGSNSYLNIDRKSYEVTESWLYELSLFNLINFYKSFNPKKQYVLFYGY